MNTATELIPGSAPAPHPPAASASSPIVSVRDLQIAFGNRQSRKTVVNSVSFDLRRGECFAIVGESGSGKSVTARTLVGLTGQNAEIRASKLEFDGQDLLTYTQKQWRHLRGGKIGLILQDALVSLDPLRAVGAEIDEVLRLHTPLGRNERHQRVLQLLDLVGVPESELRARQLPHTLSGGLRQRALIASALAGDPQLLIADEPTTALDVTVQAQVLNVLADLKESGKTLLIISHDLAVVSQLADRVAVMHAGDIVETGPTAEVLAAPQHPYTRELLAAVPGNKRTKSRGNLVTQDPITSPKSASDPVRQGGPQLDVVAQVENVARTFPGPGDTKRQAVSDVSFSLNAAQTLGIVGESGSGKTTTARILLGLLEPTRGTVTVFGQQWRDSSPRQRRELRKHIQVIPQDPLSSFDPRLKVGRILSDALRVAGVNSAAARRVQAGQLLQQVGLDEACLDRKPLQMSGGQRQRVAIARALAPSPGLIVCDEPVSALDVSVQAQVLDLLTDVQRETGVAYVFISHDLAVVRQISDHVLVMQNGFVVESGEVDEVFENPKHPYTKELIAAVPRLKIDPVHQY